MYFIACSLHRSALCSRLQIIFERRVSQWILSWLKGCVWAKEYWFRVSREMPVLGNGSEDDIVDDPWLLRLRKVYKCDDMNKLVVKKSSDEILPQSKPSYSDSLTSNPSGVHIPSSLMSSLLVDWTSAHYLHSMSLLDISKRNTLSDLIHYYVRK
jgi:hypothetical protein